MTRDEFIAEHRIYGLRPGRLWQKVYCPKCQDQRKNNKRDKPLAVKTEGEEIYVCCHHCGC